MDQKQYLYKIYYKNEKDGKNKLVYIGRTRQSIQARIRGHFFSKPMMKNISIFLVTRIEYAELKSVADMYLYEVYYINKDKPPIKCSDKARDKLTVTLPELKWKKYNCKLMDKWKAELGKNEEKRKGEQCEYYSWT